METVSFFQAKEQLSNGTFIYNIVKVTWEPVETHTDPIIARRRVTELTDEARTSPDPKATFVRLT